MPKRRSRRRALARGEDALPSAALVPRLPAEALHQLILHRGLDACAELMLAATPAQIAKVLDADLWRPPQPGGNEQFDADRFGEWIEALVDAEPEAAAAAFTRVDPAVVVAGLSQYLRVFDPGTFEPVAQSDDEQPIALVLGDADSYSAEVGGYMLFARRRDTWDAIVALLVALEARHQDRFHAVMRGCRAQSNSRPEIDGLDDLLMAPEQLMHDLHVDRDDRRAVDGYVSAPEARAFLDLARQTGAPPAPAPSGRAGLVHVSRAGDRDESRTREIAFLANTLIAGSSIQARPFTAQEAAEAAVATCLLGVEVMSGQVIERASLAAYELTPAFQQGWRVLHAEIGAHTADRLIAMLPEIGSADSELEAGLGDLRRALVRHRAAGRPWHAREALDVIATLDLPVWTGLLGLLDECPNLAASITAITSRSIDPIDAAAFEFFSTMAQVRHAQRFVAMIPGLLGG